MTTAAVIGAGELGGAVAYAIAAREAVSQVVIIDSAGSAAAGKALDLQQMGAISGWHTRVRGSSDVSDVIGCGVCVVADRFRSAPGELQGDDGRALLESLASSLGDAPVIFAGADHAQLLAAAVAAGYPRRRIIGSSTEAFASSVRAMVALEARCAPAEVSLSVLGTPPAGLVVAWSEAAIGGHALDRIVSTVELNRIQLRVSRLWPPGPLTLGNHPDGQQNANGFQDECLHPEPVAPVREGERGHRHEQRAENPEQPPATAPLPPPAVQRWSGCLPCSLRPGRLCRRNSHTGASVQPALYLRRGPAPPFRREWRR